MMNCKAQNPAGGGLRAPAKFFPGTYLRPIMYPANLTEAGEDGRVRVGVEKGVLFSLLHRLLTDICLAGASISVRVRFFCRRF